MLVLSYKEKKLDMKTLFTKISWLCFVFTIMHGSALPQNNSQHQTGGKRVALVIGAQNYTVLPPLRNSVNDAKAMSAALQAKGFQVDALYNPKTKKEIKDAITRYYNIMKDQVDAVGIIYYAGHGMQLDGNNYLIPTNASLQIPDDLDDQCVKMNAVMSALKAASNSLNILLLDACRSLPSFSRDSEQGWTKVEAPRGSIVVFATEAGKVASDGTGKNGLFTSKLLNVINEPGLNISEVFKRVKRDVYNESSQKQLPSVEDNTVGGDFYFTPPVVTTKSVASQPEEKKDSNTASSKGESSTPGTINFGTDIKTIAIGGHEWINKNLNVSKFANGDPISEVRTIEEWKKAGEEKKPAWCYYENSIGNGNTFGKLYNWYAVVDTRGLCPSGWHVPSEVEWSSLIGALNKKSQADQLKSTTHWGETGKGTDDHQFTALPGGMRYGTGKFESLNKEAYWWTSTESSSSYATGRLIGSQLNLIYKNNYKKDDGFSVRCVKD